MIRSRRSLRLLGIAAMAAMLFAQIAYVLAACSDYRAQSRTLLAAAQHADTVDCHEADVNANLCLAHCQGRDQTLDKHHVRVPAVLPQHVLTLRNANLAFHPDLISAHLSDAIPAPPTRILFQSLLI